MHGVSTRALAAAGALWSLSAVAQEPVQHLADRPLSELNLVQVMAGGAALVEARDGAAVIVRVGDLLGVEMLEIRQIFGGCLILSTEGEGPTRLCVEERPVPNV